ncbi:MAG: C45 family peptidase [Candidatus Woesearchaeota archaeon]
MKIIKLLGSNYEFGYKLGLLFSDAIKYRIKKFKINDKLLKKKQKYIYQTKKLAELYSNYYEELRGIANASKVSFNEIIMLNLLGLLDISRCSSIAIKTKNNLLIAHNEDGDNFERKNDFALIKYEKKDFYFYSFFYPGELLGSTFSWNSYGLIITTNSIRSKLSKKPKLPRVFLSRALIEAKSIKQAISIIKKIKISGGLHYFIADSKKIISVELYQNKFYIKNVKGIEIHTNHYLYEKFRKKTKQSKNSLTRYKRLKELITELKKEENFIDFLNNSTYLKKNILNNILKIMYDRRTKPNSIYNKKSDKNQTLATFIYLNNEKHVFKNPNFI